MNRGTIENEWQQLLSYLPEEFRELAKEYRQLETQYGNAKIKTAEHLLRAIFVHVGAGLPLRQSVALIEQAGGVSISHVTLHQKMRRAAPYLQALVHEMSATSRESPPTELWAGYDIVAIDATTDSTPGSTGTDMRLHTAVRVADLTVLYAEATGASGGETLKRVPLHAGQLALVDRGYCNGPGIASAVKRRADVLCRLNRGALPLIGRDGRPLNSLKCLRSLKGRRVGEWLVQVETTLAGEEMEIPGRLIAVRLPKEEAEEARRRVRKEYGRNASDEMLEAAGYVALFTTVPSERMTAAHCIALYRLRWQIELLFKRWKSICGLDELPNFIEDTVLSWVLGKILLALILERMGSAAAELFPPKRLDTPSHSRRGHAATSPAA